MTQNEIILCNVKKSFKENVKGNRTTYDTIADSLNDVNNKEISSFEFLNKPVRRLYLDIENIPHDNKDLIYDLISDLRDTLHISKDIKHHLTFNKSSLSHAGLSYHVIFNVCMDYKAMSRCILYFKSKYEEYANYVDVSVYSSSRLFRLPYNGKPLGAKIDNEDFHEIISEGSKLEDCFIQDTANYPVIDEDTLPKEILTFDIKKYMKERREKQKIEGLPDESPDFDRNKDLEEFVINHTEQTDKRLDNIEQEVKVMNTQLSKIINDNEETRRVMSNVNLLVEMCLKEQTKKEEK